MATATAPPVPRPAPPRSGDPKARPPKLAEGIELVGEFEDSGFKEPPYIARRADGQVIQLPRLLYMVAEEADGRRGFAEIAERVSERFGRGLSGDNVQFLVEKKLRPLGVLAGADGSSPKLRKADPMLALKFRTALVAERAVNAITRLFLPLFWPPVVVAMLAGLVALDVWLFLVHGVAQSTRELLYQPALLLLVLGLVVLSAAFHECGHATACRYGGARPGVMGAGIYIVWPAFYTDVTDAYRLGRAGRLRTDLGGVYFNAVFSLATAGAYFVTGFEPLLVIIVLQHLEMLHQFLPFLRLDGYYILSDLTGVPDMFSRIKPTLRSLIPGRKTDPRVAELKPWARAVTTGYVLLLVPTLAFVFVVMVINAPRMVATAWDSLFVHTDRVSKAFSEGSALTGVGGILQTIGLVLPVAGITATAVRGSRRFGGAAWTATEGRPAARGGLVAALVAAAGFTAFTLWPNGDYRPIQPGERGTLLGAVRSVDAIPTGRPGLTPEREAQLGGAPTVRETGGDFRGSGAERAPARDGRPPRGGERRSSSGRGERDSGSGSDRSRSDGGAPEEGAQPPPQDSTAPPSPGTETAPPPPGSSTTEPDSTTTPSQP